MEQVVKAPELQVLVISPLIWCCSAEVGHHAGHEWHILLQLPQFPQVGLIFFWCHCWRRASHACDGGGREKGGWWSWGGGRLGK